MHERAQPFIISTEIYYINSIEIVLMLKFIARFNNACHEIIEAEWGIHASGT